MYHTVLTLISSAPNKCSCLLLLQSLPAQPEQAIPQVLEGLPLRCVPVKMQLKPFIPQKVFKSLGTTLSTKWLHSTPAPAAEQ